MKTRIPRLYWSFRWLGIGGIALALAWGPAALAQEALADRPIVAGTGNRLSGRLDVLFVGPEDHFQARALDEFARAVAQRCDLNMSVNTTAQYSGESPAASLVVFGRVPTPDEAGRLVSAARTAKSVFAVLDAAVMEDLPAALTESAGSVSRLHPGDPGHAWLFDLPPADPVQYGILALTLDGDDTPRVFAWWAAGQDRFEALMTFLLRHVILRGGRILHVPALFTHVTGRIDDRDRVTLDVKTALPGRVTLEVLDLDGKPCVPSGPVRPIDLAAVPDPDRSLARLLYHGPAGLRGEARLWFRDLMPETLPTITLRGPPRLPEGEALRLRLDVTLANGKPAGGVTAQAHAGEVMASSVTNALGSAWLVLPPFPAATTGTRRIEVRAKGRRFDSKLEAGITVIPRKRRLFIDLDRPVVRPGGKAQIRVIAMDGISHRALPGEAVTIEVVDPEDRLLARQVCDTGDFGEAVATIPLADTLAEGDYTACAALGDVEEVARFRVEDVVLPRFRVRVELARDRLSAGDRIHGVVQAETFSGVPLAWAKVRLELPARRPHRVTATTHLDAGGAGTFSLDAPAWHVARPALHVTVDHHGARVTRRVPIPMKSAPWIRICCSTCPSPLVAGIPGVIRIEARDENNDPVYPRFHWHISKPRARKGSAHKVASIPVPADHPPGTIDLHVRAEGSDGKRPIVEELTTEIPVKEGVSLESPSTVNRGSTLAASIRSPRPAGVVHLDLAQDGRLLTGTSVRLEGGAGQASIPIPPGSCGPVLLVARFADDPDRIAAQRRIDVVSAPLGVSLELDRSKGRPGETVECTIQVRDATGRGIPALLDVRGFDRRYLEAAGDIGASLGDRIANTGVGKRAQRLGRIEGQGVRSRMIIESHRMAFPVLRKAAEAIREGRAPGLVLPWGPNVCQTRIGARLFLDAEPAITFTPAAMAAPRHRGPGTVARGPVRGPVLPVRILLPSGRSPAPGSGTSKESWEGFTWFQKCQAPNGSFPVLAPAALAGLGPDESPGDPWFEPGTTGLVLLAHLGAGYTHQAGRYKRLVAAALDHVRSIQNAEGFIGDADAPWALLNHAICTLALAEAWGMTNQPTLRPCVEYAIQALASRQRSDGGFGEAGYSDASLVLIAWVSLAIGSAKRGGIEIPEALIHGIRRWIETRTDPGTGTVAAGKDELDLYPFADTASVRYAAAMPAIVRMLLLDQNPDKHPVVMRLADALLERIPAPEDRDLHGVYWGTIAMFQVGGRKWAKWNMAMKRAVVNTQLRRGRGRGAWPGYGRVGRVANTCFGTFCLEVYYRYGKVFGSREPGAFSGRVPVEERPRRSFPDLLIADLAHPTVHGGRAKIPLRLPDSITHWDLRIGAWDGKGGYGRAAATIRATLPLHLEVDMPKLMYEGDRCHLPVRIRSMLDRDVTATLRVARAERIEVLNPDPRPVRVPAGETVSVPFTLVAKDPGEARLVLEVQDGKRRDAVERTAKILTRAVPFTVSRLLRAGSTFRPGDGLPPDGVHLHGRLRVMADPLGETVAGLKALLRRPTGCFEQTSATLYPALLALAYLEKTGRVAPETAARVRMDATLGYQRILGYEVDGGGFSLYGKPPARPDLTALGIHVLSALKAVQPVDRAVLARAAEFLEDHLPKDHAEQIYAVAALNRAGVENVPKAPVRLALAQADPYTVSLAVCHGLAGKWAVSRAREILEAGAEPDGAFVIWNPKRSTLFTGDTHGSWLETTALAVEALSLLGGSRDLIDRGLGALRRARKEDGGWRTTRETVTCLRALLAVTRDGPADGTLVVLRGGRPSHRIRIGGKKICAPVDLGAVKRSEEIALTFHGTGEPRITATVSGVSPTPPANTGPLAIEATWSEAPSAPGALAFCEVKIRNRSTRPVYAALVEVPIPCGFRPDFAPVARAAGISHIEVRSGRLYLYTNWVPRSGHVQLRIPFATNMAGRFHTGCVRGWPYYEPEQVSACTGRILAVGQGGR